MEINSSKRLLRVTDEYWQYTKLAYNNNRTMVDRTPEYEWPPIEGEEYSSGYSRRDIILMSFFLTAIILLIVGGNMLVCIIMTRTTNKPPKTVQNWFVAGLAVSDLLLGLIVMPFCLARHVMGYSIFGHFWDRMIMALHVFLCTVSINTLYLINLDRYWTLTKAKTYLRKRTPLRSLAMVICVWVLSAFIAVPPLFVWKNPQKLSCYPQYLFSNDVGFVLYTAFAWFFLPVSFLVFIYCRIVMITWSGTMQHPKQRQKTVAGHDTTACDPKAKPTKATMNFNNLQIVVLQSCRIEKRMQDAVTKTLLHEPLGEIEDTSAGFDKLFVDDNQIKRPSLLIKPKIHKSSLGFTTVLADLGPLNISDIDNKKYCNKTLEEIHVNLPSVRYPASKAVHQRISTSETKYHDTLILGLIVASFVLSWTPFYVLYILRALCTTCDIKATAFMVTLWLGYCISAVRPFIYIRSAQSFDFAERIPKNRTAAGRRKNILSLKFLLNKKFSK